MNEKAITGHVLYDARYLLCPSGLMAGAQTATRIIVKVFMEHDQNAPVRIFCEASILVCCGQSLKMELGAYLAVQTFAAKRWRYG